MTEIFVEMFNPYYWITVVPIGLAMLAGAWKYDHATVPVVDFSKLEDVDG